uniref:Putative replicase n=1 Tax=Torrey Pines virus TaxID=1654361 RepID=A0A0F7KMP3_9REOV|nr:putative replicase [Torrey Pines virus]
MNSDDSNATLPDILTHIHPEQMHIFYAQLSTILNDTANEKNLMFKYLTTVRDITQCETGEVYGLKATILKRLPPGLFTPRQFNYDMYPLNDNKSMFASKRNYNYLTTFQLSSFLKSDKNDVRYQGILSMIEDQCQSRFSSIWRLLASVVYCNDCLNATQPDFLRHYIKLLIGRYNALPFYERRGKIVFTSVEIASIMPTLMYMLMSVATEYIVKNISMNEAIICINHYLNIAQAGYCDAKLSMKSAVRNWVTEALHNVGVARVIRWSVSGVPMFHTEVSTSECKGITDTFKLARAERESKLPEYLVVMIDTALRQMKTVAEVIQFLRFSHAISNDRTFYKTLVELSLDKAIKPNVYETIVQAPTPKLYGARREIIEFEFDKSQAAAYRAQMFLHDVADHILSKVGRVDFDTEWIKFLTTSSAGKRLDPEILISKTELIQKLHNRRIVRAAIEADMYRDMRIITASIQDATLLVVRQQIDRRQRAIAGLTNPKLFTSFPSYILGKTFYPVIDAVAQGKQLGNILDTCMLLSATSSESVLCSSIDIAGMDTSIQVSVRRIYDSFTFRLARSMLHSTFGPWADDAAATYALDDDEQTNPRLNVLSGIFRALLFHSVTMQGSTRYESRMFNIVQGREGTFESGRADTSTHHTVLLSSLLNISRVLYREAGKPEFGQLLKVMGDDIFVTYAGRDQGQLYEQVIYDSELLNSMGFKTTLDCSRNHAIFLQQHCILGRFFGLSTRIGLFTREHSKVVNSLKEAAAELRALRDDLLSRVVSTERLSHLTNSIALWCLSRHTVRVVSSSQRSLIRNVLTKNDIITQTYPNNDLITICFPPMWAFMPGGGDLPLPPIIVKECATQGQLPYTPTGKWRRKILIDFEKFLYGEFNESQFGKNELYNRLMFNQAELMIKLDLSGLLKGLRLSEERRLEVNNLADKLDSVTPSTQRDKSRIAYHELSTRGFKLDRSHVFAYRTHTKITQVVLDGEIDDSSGFDMGDAMIAKFIELRVIPNASTSANALKHALRYRIRFEGTSDYLHLWDMVQQDVPVARYHENISTSIVPFMFPFEDSRSVERFIFNAMGCPGVTEGSLKNELALIKGKFHNFKVTDAAFKMAQKLFFKSPDLLDTFYDAIGASDRERFILTKMIKFYSDACTPYYSYVTSPRQMFAFSDDIIRLNKTYMYNPPNLVNAESQCEFYHLIGSDTLRAFKLTCAYLGLMTGIPTCYDAKQAIALDPRLIKTLANEVRINRIAL